MKPLFFDSANRKITGKALTVIGLMLALTTTIFVPRFTTVHASGKAVADVTGAPSAPAAKAAAPRAVAAPQRTGRVRLPLQGWVDMHTHPMSHLGFGKKLMHGAPDIGSLVPAGTYHCNSTDFRAKTMKEAMGSCASTHGGWGFDNQCGDYLRAFMINAFIDEKFAWKLPPEQNLHLDHQHEGYPKFEYWPHQTSKLHQQMWYEWIKRAHEGGLNVMVALSVNSQLLANAINGDSPTLDRASSDLQVKEIKYFVVRHSDFMEVAYSSDDLRRIVGAGKLAVILGMEIDDFGGFEQQGPTFKNFPHTFQRLLVKNEIQRVYDMGVRYLFPIHLSNNVFGGSGVYSSIFNFANKHNTGSFMDITTSPDPAIQYNLNFLNAGTPLVLSMAPGVFDAIAGFPAPCFGAGGIPGTVGSCSPALGIIKDAVTPDAKWVNYQSVVPGHINSQGLTPLGEYALLEMMKLGMIIDIDHMGMKSRETALHWAEVFKGGYPVNLGHNGLRQNDEHHEATERNVDAATIRRVARLQGMFGLGTADLTPDEFIEEYEKVVQAIEGPNALDVRAGRTPLYGALGVGTDANGLEPLPKATAGLDSATFYSNGLTKLETAGGIAKGGKTWDYTKEGVAHYGLMKEFMRDVKARKRDQRVYDRLWDSAEYFARMWEKCETLSDK